MKERSVANKNLRPNTDIYASVLNACAFTFGTDETKSEALSIAIDTFKECQQRNDVVYGTFIKACNILMDTDDIRRIPMIETSFLQCRKRGEISDFVLLELFSSLSSRHYKELLGHDMDGLLSVQDVPRSWSRNVAKR